MLSGEDEPAAASSGWLEALAFALAAAVAIQVARLAAGLPRRGAGVAVSRTSACSCCRSSPRTSLTGAGSAPAGGCYGARRSSLAAVVVNVYPFSADSATEVARRAPPAGRAVVRGRLPVHGRHAPIARAAHGLRPLHRRVVHLLRADRARRRRAGRAHRADPRADRRRRRRAGRRVGAAVRRRRRRDRRGLARRGQAARGGEHGARADHGLHPAVRRDAGRRRRRSTR